MKNPVAAAEPEQVQRMFDTIAGRYDLANHVLSCGFDFLWRAHAARIIAADRPRKILDLAAGTGDLTLVLQRKIPGAEIVAADFSEEMLAIARRKGVHHTLAADARQLPFPDGEFDAVTIAFGLRNLPHWGEGLREMVRVLRPGGRLLVLEFSLPENAMMRAAYRKYLHWWVPRVGSLLTKQQSAYDYLGETIESFPRGNAMLRLIEQSGLNAAVARPLTGGIVSIYTAVR